MYHKLNLIIQNHKRNILFLIVSIVSLFTYGLSESSYQIYILTPIEEIKNNLSINFFNSYFISELSIQRYFFIIFETILLNKYTYTILSVLIKFLCFVMIFKVSNFFFHNERFSFIFSLIFLSAPTYYSHGMIVNGAWSAHMLINASISFFTILISLYLVLKNKLILGSLIGLAAISFHPLYGINYFIYLIFIIIISKNKISKKLISFVILSLSVFYVRNIGSKVVEKSDNFIGVKEWFKETFYLNTNDFSFLNNLLEYNFYFIVISFLTLLFIQKNYIETKRISFLEKLCIFTILFYFVVTIFEILHLNNLFFEYLSELFIQLQFRRGIWLGYLILNLYIFNHFLVYFKNSENIYSQILILGFIVNLLIPTFLITFCIVMLLYKLKKISFYSTLLLGVLISILILFFEDSYLQGLAIFQIFIFIFLVFLLFLFYKKYKDNYSIFVNLVYLILIFFFLFGVYEKKFLNSITALGYEISDEYLLAIDHLNKLNPNKDPIYTNIIDYRAQGILKQNIIITKSDILRAATSRNIYFNTKSKIYKATLDQEYSDKFYYPKIEVLNGDSNSEFRDDMSKFNPKFLYSNYFAKISHMEYLTRIKIESLSNIILRKTHSDVFCTDNSFKFYFYEKNNEDEIFNNKNVLYQNKKYVIIDC